MAKRERYEDSEKTSAEIRIEGLEAIFKKLDNINIKKQKVSKELNELNRDISELKNTIKFKTNKVFTDKVIEALHFLDKKGEFTEHINNIYLIGLDGNGFNGGRVVVMIYEWTMSESLTNRSVWLVSADDVTYHIDRKAKLCTYTPKSKSTKKNARNINKMRSFYLWLDGVCIAPKQKFKAFCREQLRRCNNRVNYIRTIKYK